ncbi:MAG: hypothetical protein GY850_23580 [bacterium]|nr:hypothetical protein [bacterium]
MFKKFVIVFAVMAVFVLTAAAAPAGEIDILLEKLVEKGVLSKDDAETVLQETRKEAAAERRRRAKDTSEAFPSGGGFAGIADLPKWVKNTSLKGDLRLRYQYSNRSGSSDRHRGRYRLRLGFVTEVADKVQVGFGLATGGSDPRSTNQTMTNSFETADVRLDYAFARYRPFDWLVLLGGKFKNPLWCPSDLLWDSDIRPEGVAAQLKHTTGTVELFLNTGFWIIDERSRDEQDPVMFVAQPGYKLRLGEKVYFKNALTYYEFNQVKGTLLDHSGGSNTLRDDGLRRDYDAIAVSAELGFKTPFERAPFCAVFGEYVRNLEAGSANGGHLLGVKFGDKKVSKRHQWQARVMYRRLERDAWLDVLPDSDAYSGRTNADGFEAVLKYGLMKNVSLGLDYYHMEHIQGASRSENVLQIDLGLKF